MKFWLGRVGVTLPKAKHNFPVCSTCFPVPYRVVAVGDTGNNTSLQFTSLSERRES